MFKWKLLSQSADNKDMAQTNETLEKYLHNQLELEAEGRMVGEEKVKGFQKLIHATLC